MITPEQSEKMVKIAEDNNIPFVSLILPHLLFWAIMFGFAIICMIKFG